MRVPLEYFQTCSYVLHPQQQCSLWKGQQQKYPDMLDEHLGMCHKLVETVPSRGEKIDTCIKCICLYDNSLNCHTKFVWSNNLVIMLDLQNLIHCPNLANFVFSIFSFGGRDVKLVKIQNVCCLYMCNLHVQHEQFT